MIHMYVIIHCGMLYIHINKFEKQQDAAHEPECSHVEHFCETCYLNSLHFSPVTLPVHCRLLNAKDGGVQSAECGV